MDNNIIYFAASILSGVVGYMLKRTEKHEETIERLKEEVAMLKERVSMLPEMQKHYYQFFGREKDTLWKTLDVVAEELKKHMQKDT